MFSKVVDFIKERSKPLYILIMLVIILALLTKYWNLVEKTGLTLLNTLKVLLTHLLSIAFILALFIGKTLLFKYSDKKTNEKIEEHEKPITTETKRGKFVKVILTEKIESTNDNHGKTLEIFLKNMAGSDINYIKGFVAIYEGKLRIKKVYFETRNLYKDYSERIFYGFLERKEHNWDSFDVFIEKIQVNNQIESNFKIDGEWFVRTHYMILNVHRFYDYRFLGVRTKYNMVWLKDKIKRELIPSVKFFYSRRTYSFTGRPWYIEFRDGLIRLARFSLVILGGLLVFLLGAFTITDIVKMLVSIYSIWKSYFQQISNVL